MRYSCTIAVVLSFIGGCSTTVRPTDTAYLQLSCAELNELVYRTSSDISRAAVTRGQIEQADIPNWVPGGRSVSAKLVDRQTGKLDNLQENQTAILAARNRNCPGR